MQLISELGPLSDAEKRLVEHQSKGTRVVIGSGDLPEQGNPEVLIRADLLRILLLRSDESIGFHPSGLRIRGAYISGQLKLQGCSVRYDVSFSSCILEKSPNLINARLRGWHLSQCHLPGFTADQAEFDGPVFLRADCVLTGEMSLPGARIHGDLQLCGVTLDPSQGAALFGNGLDVSGSVYFGNYPYAPGDSSLIATGPIFMASVSIGRDFYIQDASLTGNGDHVQGLQPDGVEGSSSTALSLARSRIGGLLFAKSLQVTRGMLNFSGVSVNRLNDEPAVEDATYRLRLDGFEYKSFAQHTDISAKARLKWLARRPAGIAFSAQPYEHLARIYEELGHRDDADRVRIAKEDLQRRDDISQLMAAQAWGRAGLLTFMRLSLRYLVGYGYRPVYALIWAVLMIAGVGLFFQKTWNAGDMTPNSAPILVSANWVSATEVAPENPGAYWSSPGQAGQDYETFNAFAYSADLLIPIVNLGQEDAWAPSTSRSWWGQQGWWLRWVSKMLGWVFTALGAAAVTGVIRRP
ncbi:MAG: hypothetical protein AAF826_04460 [Pseudomonadota bacterium]